MGYSIESLSGSRGGWRVSYSEEDVAAGYELAIHGGFPTVVTIADHAWELESGTGTTITPAVGVATGHVAGGASRVATYDAAAHQRDNTSYSIPDVVDGILYLQLEPDAGADNAVSGSLVVIAGV